MLERSDDFIEMRYGDFSLSNPVFDIRDIAWSMSMQCRYTGRSAAFYSIAAHSIVVSELMETLKLGDPLEGLLHDAGESVMSDLASPIKYQAQLSGYRDYEDYVDTCMRRQFGIVETKTPGCDRADKLALFGEAQYLMRSGGQNWYDKYGLRDQARAAAKPGWWYMTDEPLKMMQPFLQRYIDLTSKTRGARH